MRCFDSVTGTPIMPPESQSFISFAALTRLSPLSGLPESITFAITSRMNRPSTQPWM